jgi:hypothetical protein
MAKRKIFEELMEGVEAMKGHREGELAAELQGRGGAASGGGGAA